MDRCKTREQREETFDFILPFLSRAHINELCSGRLYTEYRERKLQLQRELVGQAIEYQKRVIAPQLARSTPRRVDGFRWVGTISDHLVASAEGKYGKGCFGDPDFLRHTLKHTPEARAPKPACPFVVVQGLRGNDLTLHDSTCAKRNNSRRPDGMITRPGPIGNTDAANGSPVGDPGSDHGARGRSQGEPAPAVLTCPLMKQSARPPL